MKKVRTASEEEGEGDEVADGYKLGDGVEQEPGGRYETYKTSSRQPNLGAVDWSRLLEREHAVVNLQ